MPNLLKLTDNTVRVTLAMLRATDFLVHESVQSMHAQATRAFDFERQQRGLSEASLYEDLGYPERVALTERYPRGEFTHDPSEEDLGEFDLREDDPQIVQFFYALGGEVTDFSCLGRGVRDHVELVWEAGSAECKRRGIKRVFFCDWVLPGVEGE